jgi:membrane protease YdiL (CAAX protease family)
MSGLSRNLETGEYREVLFWLLLLGSWQFLASPGSKNSIIGAIGTAAFLVFAWHNMDRLSGLGLDHARWRSANGADWAYAAVTGILAGSAVFAIATALGEDMRLSDDWRLVALQFTLGPVLEEIMFRGYLFALLMWAFRGIGEYPVRNLLVIVLTAVAFSVVHLTRPGVSWLQLACIVSTGTLYGWIRCRSGSTGPASVSHAAYNLTLYAIVGVMSVGPKAALE